MINRHDPGYEGKGSRRWRGGFTELETRLAMCKGKIRKVRDRVKSTKLTSAVHTISRL